MDWTACVIALGPRATWIEATSALPDAPVVSDEPPRPGVIRRGLRALVSLARGRRASRRWTVQRAEHGARVA